MVANNAKTFQSAPTIIALPMSIVPGSVGAVGIYNFLSKDFATCSMHALPLLSFFSEQHTLEEAQAHESGLTPEETEQLVCSLLELGFLAETGSPEYEMHESYRRNWEWDTLVGAFHFSIMNHEFMSLDASVESQLARLSETAPLSLSWLPINSSSIELPRLSSSPAHAHLNLLAKRRTNRTSSGYVLSLREIGDCLFGAFGVCQYVQAPMGMLPLSSAPSGGARNPYETYVLIQRCNELEPGVYHYSTTTHQLTLVNAIDERVSFSELLAGQDWSDSLAAIVIMVAILERTMWKYQDANAYRVILIEAGHRAQNFMTVATHYGLTVCPTAALAHSKIQKLLKLDNALLHVPVYALTLDKALPYPDQIYPNENCPELASILAPRGDAFSVSN